MRPLSLLRLHFNVGVEERVKMAIFKQCVFFTTIFYSISDKNKKVPTKNGTICTLVRLF